VVLIAYIENFDEIPYVCNKKPSGQDKKDINGNKKQNLPKK